MCIGGWWREQQVPPLRYAPVGMTIHIWVRDASAQENCHPDKKSQTLRMTPFSRGLKNIWSGAKNAKRSKKSQALGMTKGRGALSSGFVAGIENSRSPFDFAQGRLSTSLLRSG